MYSVQLKMAYTFFMPAAKHWASPLVSLTCTFRFYGNKSICGGGALSSFIVVDKQSDPQTWSTVLLFAASLPD